jgi:hypothetical protein
MGLVTAGLALANPGQARFGLGRRKRRRSAVPFHEARCALLKNRAMSPTPTRSRIADGPVPCRVASVLPVADSSSPSSLLTTFVRW